MEANFGSQRNFGRKSSNDVSFGRGAPDFTPCDPHFSKLLKNLSEESKNIGYGTFDFSNEDRNMTSDELDAKLARNKAEVDLVAAEMRREMAEFRTFQSQQLSSISISLAEIKGEISAAKGESLGQKEGLAGQIDGVKSSISTMQWMIGTVLAMIGIVAAVLAIPGVDKVFK